MDLDSVDFGSLAGKANEMINAEPAAADTPAETPVAAPLSTTGDSSTPSGTPPSTQTLNEQTGAIPPASASPAEEKLQLELGNGKVESLTRQEIAQRLVEAERSGLRQADYTRKTQEAAALSQQAQLQQQQAQQALAQAQYLLNNPHLLQAEAQRRALASQPIDPTQPMTVGQGMQLAEAMRGEVATLQQQALAQVQLAERQAATIVEDRLQVANMSESIGKTLSEVYTAHPVLKTNPEFETIMRYRVAQMQPETIEDTLKAFKQVGDDLGKSIGGVFKQQQQAQVAQQAKLVSQGIEPPGGVAPQPAKQDYKSKDGRDLDWNRLKEAATLLGS